MGNASLPTVKELYLQFEEEGIASFRYDRLAREFVESWTEYPLANEEEKQWAYKRGFTADRIKLYGLTEFNYHNYISDIGFYLKDSYKNILHSRWYDDKLSTWYILAPFKDKMPRHFYYLKDGMVHPLDMLKGEEARYEGLLNTLKLEGNLALKACFGGHGIGFHKASFNSDTEKIYVDGNFIEEAEFVKKFLPHLDNYIATEFILPLNELTEVTNGVSGVVRCVTVFVDGAPHLIAAIYKFGSQPDDLVVDYEGTLYCGVDLENGHFFAPKIREDYGKCYIYTDCPTHPITGLPIEGAVPKWTTFKEQVLEIARYLQPTPYLTFDIVP